MCETNEKSVSEVKTIPVREAVGTVLAHDITEIRPGEFKDRAFKKGHIIKEEDVCHLQRLGKEHLFVLHVGDDEMHEDAAAFTLARAMMGHGVSMQGEPSEGKINIVADRDGLLRINKEALLRFNMLGEVMCATLHNNTVVKKAQIVGGTRAIPLVVKKKIVEEAVRIANSFNKSKGQSVTLRQAQDDTSRRAQGDNNVMVSLSNHDIMTLGHSDTSSNPRTLEPSQTGVIEVKEMRKPKAGIVITGNEVYYGRVKDAFAPIIREKVAAFHGEIVGIYYAPDDGHYIEERLRELVAAGADLLMVTGGMSVDPDDVTRFAIRNLGAEDITYGSAALPGAMFLVAYIAHSSSLIAHSKKSHEPSTMNHQPIPILGIPACGMYHKTTVLDLILPRVLAGETIGRRELAELGHGGLCLNCKECRYPVCPFGK